MNLELEHIAWSRRLFAGLAPGGMWGVPRSGLLFRKESATTLTLTELMPHDDAMPMSAAELLEYQEDDFREIQRHFQAAGITVTRGAGRDRQTTRGGDDVETTLDRFTVKEFETKLLEIRDGASSRITEEVGEAQEAVRAVWHTAEIALGLLDPSYVPKREAMQDVETLLARYGSHS